MSRILRWEILPGLPGEGPIPKHFHFGHPTPWAEGFVVRFRNVDGSAWVGNFCGGWTLFRSVLDWPEGDKIVIVACGAFYLLPKAEPDKYTTHESGVTDALFDEAKSVLVLSNVGGYLVAYSRTGSRIWERQGIRPECSSEGEVTAEIEGDDGSWRTIRLSIVDGRDLDRKRFLRLAWRKLLQAFWIAFVWYVCAYGALLNLSLPLLYGLYAVQAGWLVTCSYNAIKLYQLGAINADGPDWIREDFAFWLGNVCFSLLTAFLLLVTPVRGVGR